MRLSHSLWITLGILTICEASIKLRTSSSTFHTHTTSVSNHVHTSTSATHSKDAPHKAVTSSKSFRSSKTFQRPKKATSISNRVTSPSKTSTKSAASRKTTESKPAVKHESTSPSFHKPSASHKSSTTATSTNHEGSASKDSASKGLPISTFQTSTLHNVVPSSSSPINPSTISKASHNSGSLISSVTSASETSTSLHSKVIQAIPVPKFQSKSVTPPASQTSKIAGQSSQSLQTSTRVYDHANATQTLNTLSISTRSVTSDSRPFRKANATQPLKANSTTATTSPPSISPSDLAIHTTAFNLTGPCSQGTFVDASCFDVLNLSEYLVQWWASNEAICNSQNAQFARCFYALETQYGPSDCSQMNNDAACTQPIWNDFKDKKNGIQNFYVAWNLYNTAGFFLDMWTAMGAAEASSQASLASIISLLDPPAQKTKMTYVLDALSFGMSLYAEGSIFMKALLRSAPQGYGLGGKIFERGTVNGEYQDWAMIAANIGKCTDVFRATVAEELPLIVNNLTTFIQWSEISGLSGYRAPLNGLAQNMTQALNTYAIARILDTQGLVISRAANTDVHALQTNGSQLNWDTGCGGGYDGLGVCDTFFWDGVDTYGLTDPSHFTKSYHDELEELFMPKDSGPSLTTGRLLFTGAQHCYQSTGQNGGSPPSLDPTDASHIVCLSNARVCTWDESGYGPFDSSCKNDPDRDAALITFGASGCKGEPDSIYSIDVPRAYLGPGIYQDFKNIDALGSDTFCDDVDS